MGYFDNPFFQNNAFFQKPFFQDNAFFKLPFFSGLTTKQPAHTNVKTSKRVQRRKAER